MDDWKSKGRGGVWVVGEGVCVWGEVEGTRNPLVAFNYVTSLKIFRNFTTNPEQPLPDKWYLNGPMLHIGKPKKNLQPKTAQGFLWNLIIITFQEMIPYRIPHSCMEHLNCYTLVYTPPVVNGLTYVASWNMGRFMQQWGKRHRILNIKLMLESLKSTINPGQP